MNGSFWQWLFIYVPIHVLISALIPNAATASFWVEWLIATAFAFPLALILDARVTRWRAKRAARRSEQKLKKLVEM